MIVVMGATGTVGRDVVRLLSARGAAVRAVTRDPAMARVPYGVEVVRADVDRPDSLAAAVHGATAVFLLAPPGAGVPRYDRRVIDVAAAAGVERVVKLSAIGAEADAGADAHPAAWHLAGERALRESGMAWTVLRPSSFASNALAWAAAVRAGSPVPNMTGTGRMGVVDPGDVAAVAVEALLTPDHHCRVYPLTGPRAISVADQAADIAAELGRPVEVVEVPLDVARVQMLAAGIDPSVVEVAVAGFALVRAGGGAVVTDDVSRVLGRPARSFRCWVRDRAAAFGVA